MKFSLSTALVVLVAGEAVVASTWFSKAGMYLDQNVIMLVCSCDA